MCIRYRPRSASRYQLGGIFNIIETGRSRICKKTVLLIDFAQYNITGISAFKGYEMIDRSKRDLPYSRIKDLSLIHIFSCHAVTSDTQKNQFRQSAGILRKSLFLDRKSVV